MLSHVSFRLGVLSLAYESDWFHWWINLLQMVSLLNEIFQRLSVEPSTSQDYPWKLIILDYNWNMLLNIVIDMGWKIREGEPDSLYMCWQSSCIRPMKLNSLVPVSGLWIWNEGTISFFIIHLYMKISILHKTRLGNKQGPGEAKCPWFSNKIMRNSIDQGQKTWKNCPWLWYALIPACTRHLI